MEVGGLDEQKFTDLEKRVDKIETRLTLAERDIMGINKKLDKIESNTGWTIKLIIGAIILAVLGLILKQGIQM